MIRRHIVNRLAETKECKSPCSSTAEMCIALCA